MRSLFVRFFLSYWLIIGLTIGMAAVAGFWYAERMRDALENFSLDDTMLEASQALDNGGRDGLARWLEAIPQTRNVSLYVLDHPGHDILDRQPPFGVVRTFRRHRDHFRERAHEEKDPRNLRRARPLTQLVAANGAAFTFIVAPSHIPDSFWAGADARILLLIMALLSSGLVSYALAKAISRPVQKLRNATHALADGNLAIRVADSIGRRRDELGMLGRDFDSMAEKLQSAVEQQTELSRNISHELRSPLARMRVAVELAKREAGNLPEFDRLEAEAERLDDLIGQILSYTRLDAGAAREAELVDLADVIHEVAENVNFECRAENIEAVSVTTSVHESPDFRGHRDALLSAIENVVRNAVTHSPPNSDVNICLSCSGKTAHIEVRDHGAGVAETDLARLFEPFFRTRQSAESSSDHGTGLGLAIAARAIHLHRGQISAENPADGGLLVRITLPL
jgi:two-component system sensor histidine kinase CpxA